MEANPNQTYKQLKQKQKFRISEWLYKEMFLYYRENKGFPDDEKYEEICRRIYEKMRSLAIWCPYDEFERNMLRKREQMQSRVMKSIEEGKTEEQFAKRPKKTEAEKLALKRENLFSDCDDTFAYIAGYTSGGVPYGTTWEEMGIDPYMDYDDKVKALLEGDF